MQEEKQDKMITKLEAKASCKNIKIGFKWENIPQFAVITGENGAGKTALLEQINQSSLSSDYGNKKIFDISNHFEIKFITDIALKNPAYTFDKYTLEGIQTACRVILDIKKNNNIVAIANRNFQVTHGKQISLEDFIKNNTNQLDEAEKRTFKVWRDTIIDIFKRYEGFFKRHNMTKEKLLFEMTEDEIEAWLNSLNDINLESKPMIFEEELLVNTFGNYFIKFENYKRTLEQKVENQNKTIKEIYKMAESKVGKNPLDRINEILQKYYSKYNIAVKRDITSEIKLFCREVNTDIEVPLDSLSLGEQIIIHLVLWQYENTTLDSLVLLLDEPDSHLNPKMAKMLIDILKNVVVKEFGCQVIMTTHSLSSVAYCDDEDLFYMENGEIKKIDKKQAIENLTDGVMTFNTAMGIIEQIQTSSKPTLLVEGSLDKIHIENFYKLSQKEIPFEIIVCGSASNMPHFAIAFKQLNIAQSKILFLCDYDNGGEEAYKKIIAQQYNVIYTLDIDCLDDNDDRKRLKNYLFEMLYPLEILKEQQLVDEIELKDYIKGLKKEEQNQKAKEFDQDTSKAKYKLKNDDTKKQNFANDVIKKLDINKDFEEIKNLINRIESKLGAV
ncbi:AAA family ATPase [Helicobacter trogontum]|uniref:Endonuclease GajA/Old nuclease/RecF-like AAA domain-containing protein n=1 Tax=Helicobacter trogontum TaxID=50960 RepID=A0A4U8SF80_9HELI|nr:ATP-binding protein [Helicobacter trogontum]TLD84869.1 hypothetical protein LS81_000395 [Helicobacter trogontum]